MDLKLIIGVFSGCSLGAAVFLKLAHKYGLQDHPVGRSSHRQPTVTGMGVIIMLAFIMYLFWQPYELPPLFVMGFLLLTTVSLIDDIYFLKHSLRLAFQILGVSMIVLQLPFQSQGLEIVALGIAAVIFGVGVLNAYNFMDGINGMLTLHAILLLSCMFYLNESLLDKEGHRILFTNSAFILSIMIPLFVFGFFNIRKNALAFMGDVGSIGISFIIIYLMYSLVLTTGNYIYLLLFATFGADAGLTVCYKLILRENIFVPHRDFLFKKLVHLAKKPHLTVSFAYFFVQMFLNVLIIVAFPKTPKLSTQLSVLFIGCLALITAYIILLQKIQPKRRNNNQPLPR